MSVKRFVLALAVAGLAVAALAVAVTPPTSASGTAGSDAGTTIQLAPPVEGPTLAPQTPDLGGLPPIDLGVLGAPRTPTPTPTVSSSGEGEVILDFDYSSCKPYDDKYVKIACSDGNLEFTRKETRGTRWVYYTSLFTDSIIETSVRLPTQKNARYGVIFRLDEAGDNYYVLGVTNEGQYGLFRYATDHYETLIPYTDSFFVGNASFTTKIKIVNQGDVIAINLGGEWVDSIRDPNLTEGRVALFLEPDEANQTVLFDYLKVTLLSSPVEVPAPRTLTPPASATATGENPVIANIDTPVPQEPTEAPRVIVVTATPRPATATRVPTRVPTRAPTRVPTKPPAQNTCPAGPNEAALLISNNYVGTTMRFTIGGGEWGTHDYDVPGDGKYYVIRMPPGTYTYTAFIAGIGTAHGERTTYSAGQCYPLRFSP